MHPRGPAGRSLVVAALAAALVVPAPRAPAREEAADAARVEALVLLRALRFLDWPEEAGLAADAPLVVAVLGDSRLPARLAEAAAEGSGAGRRISLRPIDRIQRAAGAQVVLLAPDRDADLPQILGWLRGKPILCVGAAPGFARRGAALGLFAEGGRVHLELNQAALREARIRASYQLLTVAELVEGAR